MIRNQNEMEVQKLLFTEETCEYLLSNLYMVLVTAGKIYIWVKLYRIIDIHRKNIRMKQQLVITIM